MLRTGARVPFLATDCTYYFMLGAGNFSPIDDVPDVMTATQEDVYIKNGFLISNATDTAGFVWVVTWEEYQAQRQRANRTLVTNAQVLALCNAVEVYLESGGFIDTPIVMVYSEAEEISYKAARLIIDDPYLGSVEIEYINVWTIR